MTEPVELSREDEDLFPSALAEHCYFEGCPEWITGSSDYCPEHAESYAPVPASQSVPAVPVSSTGGKETGEAAETGTEALNALAALVDPDVWVANRSDQDTVGAQWQHTERRRLSLAAAERLLAAGWRPSLPKHDLRMMRSLLAGIIDGHFGDDYREQAEA